MDDEHTFTSRPDARRVRFGAFELDLDTGELSREGVPVALSPQPTRVLCLLVGRAGRLVTRDELRELLWPDTVVEFDHGLNTCVRQIRDALGERAEDPTHVQTVPRRGYRFIARVSPVPQESSAARRRGRRALAAAGALVVVLVLGALALGSFEGPERGRRIAVLPFQNLSPEEVSPAFVDGLSEELIVELARHDPAELAVISRLSARRLADDGLAAREIAARLHATHLVTGTVRATGRDLEVTASLVRVRDEITVWSGRFAAPDLDPLARMGPLGRRVAAALTDELAPTAVARSSPDADARAELLRGRHLLADHRPAMAADHLERAVALDPGFALAYGVLSRARLQARDTAAAAAAATRALELGPRLPETHQALGDLAAMARWDWPTALAEYREAIALAPGNAELRQGHAYVLSLLGHHGEAVAEIELALSLDPVSPLVNGDAAWLYFYARRHAEAIAQARATVALDPDNAPAWYFLVRVLEAGGEVEEARRVAAQVAERNGAPPEVVAGIGRSDPATGVDRFWRWDLAQMAENEMASRYPLDFAAAYARFHEPGRALGFIERSVDGGQIFAPIIAVDPRFDPLRSEPRFARALARLNLPATVGT